MHVCVCVCVGCMVVFLPFCPFACLSCCVSVCAMYHVVILAPDSTAPSPPLACAWAFLDGKTDPCSVIRTMREDRMRMVVEREHYEFVHQVCVCVCACVHMCVYNQTQPHTCSLTLHM